MSYQTISLHELIGLPKNKKEYQEWLIAHKVIEIAKEKGKAIAIEDLKKVNNGYRGDGKAKLRKGLHNWNFKNLLLKIERVARLNGIEVWNRSYESKSRFYLGYWKSKVCTAIKHKQRHSRGLCNW